MTERIPRLRPTDLDDEQQALYASIVGGPRTKGAQLFTVVAEDGSLNGPFGLMLHVPHLGKPLEDLGAALRYRSGLSAREREIAILSVAATTRSSFEMFAHSLVGRSVGLTAGEVHALATAEFTSVDPREVCAARVCTQLVHDPQPDASLWDQAAARFSAQETLELIALAGYYRTISQMMEVFGVTADSGRTDQRPE